MEPMELVWLAGWLEGEGSFMSGPPSDPNCPRITAQCSDEDVCLHGATLCGVSICSCKTYSPSHKPTWRMTLRGKRARLLMAELYQYMGSRRKSQIDKALSSWSPDYKPRTTIPKETIIEVRRLCSQMPHKVLADRFDISIGQVKDIRRGVTGAWAV